MMTTLNIASLDRLNCINFTSNFFIHFQNFFQSMNYYGVTIISLYLWHIPYEFPPREITAHKLGPP